MLTKYLKPPPSLVSGVFHGLPKRASIRATPGICQSRSLNRLPCHPSNQTATKDSIPQRSLAFLLIPSPFLLNHLCKPWQSSPPLKKSSTLELLMK